MPKPSTLGQPAPQKPRCAPKLGHVTDTAPHPSVPAPAVLKLTSPAEVVAAVPYLLGFQPANSVVLLSLRGPRHRVGLTLRADLPAPQGVLEGVAELVEYLRRDGAEAVIAVFYAAETDAAETWHALSEALRQAGLSLREALRISQGRWWSYLCTVPACCPTAGTVILSPHEPGGPARVGAEMVSAGLVALGSREELADTVRAADPAVLAAAEGVLAAAAEQVVRRVVRPGGLAACRREWQRHLVRVLQERASPQPAPPVTAEELAGLLIAIADPPTRDLAADWASGRGEVAAAAAQSLWLELTRRAPPPYDVAPATLLAHAAWFAGNGALARVAVERALASDPSYRLAQLIERLLDEGVDPAKARRLRKRGRHRRIT